MNVAEKIALYGDALDNFQPARIPAPTLDIEKYQIKLSYQKDGKEVTCRNLDMKNKIEAISRQEDDLGRTFFADVKSIEQAAAFYLTDRPEIDRVVAYLYAPSLFGGLTNLWVGKMILEDAGHYDGEGEIYVVSLPPTFIFESDPF